MKYSYFFLSISVPILLFIIIAYNWNETEGFAPATGVAIPTGSQTHICTEMNSYMSWIQSLRILYPSVYNSMVNGFDSTNMLAVSDKLKFCPILEQYTILKTMSESELKSTHVISEKLNKA